MIQPELNRILVFPFIAISQVRNVPTDEGPKDYSISAIDFGENRFVRRPMVVAAMPFREEDGVKLFELDRRIVIFDQETFFTKRGAIRAGAMALTGARRITRRRQRQTLT